MVRRITIKDIARKAGVSPQTVSRALNDKGEIRSETRARILHIAKQLGYRPNSVARSLATQRTRNLGLVVPDVSNPFFASIARGIQDAAHQSQYNVFLCNTDENTDREQSAILSLEAQRVDGIILCSSRLPETDLIQLARRYQPLVLVNRCITHPQTGCVIVDDARAMQRAVQYLLELGHRRIGLLAGPAESHSGQQRSQGYDRAMHASGIAPPSEWKTHCPPQVDGGQSAARTLLQRAPELTAVVAYNDLVAVGALWACAELGLSVPEDCAILGCDDVLLAALVSPPLTTIHIPTYDLGQRAMGLLLRMMDPQASERDTQPTPILISPTLVIRDSVNRPNPDPRPNLERSPI
jgi:LacI family transcriptional regulator